MIEPSALTGFHDAAKVTSPPARFLLFPFGWHVLALFPLPRRAGEQFALDPTSHPAEALFGCLAIGRFVVHVDDLGGHRWGDAEDFADLFPVLDVYPAHVDSTGF